MRIPHIVLISLLLAAPLAGQDSRIRPIDAPAQPPLPLITITDADRVSVLLSLLESGYPYLVKEAGTTKLRLFLEVLPSDARAHDSLRTLARRHPSVRLCGRGFSRCSGPYPSLHIVYIEPYSPGQAGITMYRNEGDNPFLWRRPLDPAVQWDRESELGYFPVAFARGDGWRHFPPRYGHVLRLISPNSPTLVAARGRNGWLISPLR